jgi:hypothetical protein
MGDRWLLLNRGELTPFRECGRAVLFEDIATVEVTVLHSPRLNADNVTKPVASN